MAKWERQQVPPAHCRNRNNPSFSSSLLDAIYRSIDDSDSGTPSLPLSSAAKIQLPEPGYKNRPFHQTHPATHRRTRDSADDRRHRRFFSATSSSDCSSFGGFSSSSSSYADSLARQRPVLTRSDRIRSDPKPLPEKKCSACSIRSRIRDLRKSPASGSPRSRLATFLNAIFAAAGGSPKKPKSSGNVERPGSLSVSSYSKSSTSKAAAPSKVFRKLEPVNVVVSDHRRPARPCGGDNLSAAWDRWRVVEMVSDFEKMEEDRESVSSSELFELDSLTVIGRELPVYETAKKSLAISRSFIL